MKKFASHLLLGATCAIFASGCGGSSAPTQAGGNTGENGGANAVATTVDTPAPEPLPIAAEECSSPDVAVQTFLDTLRAGDERKAVSLLTNKARNETHRRGMTVQPPGSSTASYEVKESRLTSKSGDAADVTSLWTEQSDDGAITYEVTWTVRQEKVGWRVSGMSTELVPGHGPQLLNFEDPEDMQRQIDQAETALAAAQQEAEQMAAQQAQQAEPAQPEPQPANDRVARKPGNSPPANEVEQPVEPAAPATTRPRSSSSQPSAKATNDSRSFRR